MAKIQTLISPEPYHFTIGFSQDVFLPKVYTILFFGSFDKEF
jgi:hypothetical protein